MPSSRARPMRCRKARTSDGVGANGLGARLDRRRASTRFSTEWAAHAREAVKVDDFSADFGILEALQKRSAALERQCAGNGRLNHAGPRPRRARPDDRSPIDERPLSRLRQFALRHEHRALARPAAPEVLRRHRADHAEFGGMAAIGAGPSPALSTRCWPCCPASA